MDTLRGILEECRALETPVCVGECLYRLCEALICCGEKWEEVKVFAEEDGLSAKIEDVTNAA